MIALLSGLKLKLYALGGLAFAALLAALKYMSWRRDEAVERAKRAEALIKRNAETAEADSEISAEYTDIRDRDDDSNLTDSNKW